MWFPMTSLYMKNSDLTGVKKILGYMLKSSTKIPGVKFHSGMKVGRENTAA